jgi:endonuclease YncB( thermonuclease family)
MTSAKGDQLNCIQALLSLLLVPALHFTSPTALWAQPPIRTLQGLVVHVSDGDHLIVNNDGTEILVRLYAIDAPELSKIRRKDQSKARHGQPFAGRAFMALSNRVLHRRVTLEIMGNDHNERVIAVVYLEDRNINLELVADGWAWASRNNRKHPEWLKYQEAEKQARTAKVGLWSLEDPIPPWEFRKERKMEDLDNW